MLDSPQANAKFIYNSCIIFITKHLPGKCHTKYFAMSIKPDLSLTFVFTTQIPCATDTYLHPYTPLFSSLTKHILVSIVYKINCFLGPVLGMQSLFQIESPEFHILYM